MDRCIKNSERLKHQLGKKMTIIAEDGKFDQLIRAALLLHHTKFLCDPDANSIKISLTKDTDCSVFDFVDEFLEKRYESLTIK